MDAANEDYVFAGNLDALEAAGRTIVRGRHRPILVIFDRGHIFALDNRCPHMGFPLDKGTVYDGILTCHWHHARFELASGCTFDLWADDVPTCPVEVRDGGVWIKPIFDEAGARDHWYQRLENGMAHDLGLVIAKSIQGLARSEVPPVEILRHAALFGARNRDGWDTGLTVLTALGNLLPSLPREEIPLALFQGIRRVAADCDGQPPRRERAALTRSPDLITLKRWLRRWTVVRHREAVERTLLSAIEGGTAPAALADLMFAAETDRVFADGGHSLDFINKAFECLDLVGWKHASAILPSVVKQMVAARGTEESTAWRQPIDLVGLLSETFSELALRCAARHGAMSWRDHAALAHALLADDPKSVVEALKEAMAAGASPVDLARALAYAAALRVARFGTANEHSDWETAHHAFTYSNAVHQALKRIGGAAAGETSYPDAIRGVFHGAMAVYLARYLNVPPQRLPGEDGDSLDDLPSDGEEIRIALLTALDRQQQVHSAARLVAQYLLRGHAPEPLIATLSHALLREDAGFHAYQMLEAGIRQFREWGNGNEGRHILIAVVRYLAAHSPTERSTFQTADVAERLMRGGHVHETAESRA